jgi:hypothetical protein
MALPASGTISLNDLQTEFGGSNPIAISEYYLGGGLVPNLVVNANVPISGQISLSNFYGAQGADPNPNAFNINNIFLSGVNSVSGNSNQITITGINVPITLTFETTSGYAFVNSENSNPEVYANIGVYVNGVLANVSSTWVQSGPGFTGGQEADLKVTVSNNDTIKVGFDTEFQGGGFFDDSGTQATFSITNDSSGNALLDTFSVQAAVS